MRNCFYVVSFFFQDYETGLKIHAGVPEPSYLILLKSVGEFVGIFSASFLVGSVMGCATALITKFTHIKQFPQLESTLFILMSYGSFLIAEVRST